MESKAINSFLTFFLPSCHSKRKSIGYAPMPFLCDLGNLDLWIYSGIHFTIASVKLSISSFNSLSIKKYDL